MATKPSSMFTFYFHDYETFGISPAYDRPSQFAGIRTDKDLNIIEDPLVIYCKPANDYLPDPQAVLITGITPQIALQKGVNEARFIQSIHEAFSQANTCILGYNNIRFDDEVTRHTLYRNFYDPYAYSWQNGNSRWDLLDVVRACYALRPEGIQWPTNEDGLPSFRLEHLTKANHIEHTHAHDAMSDVYATIAIAKLVKTHQPKLFEYLFSLRNKKQVIDLIDVMEMAPLVHVSGMLGAYRGNTTWIAPIIWHPLQPNAVIVCDLMGDIDSLIECSAEALKERLYTKKEDLSEGQNRIPLKLMHVNKCPVIAPAKTLLPENAQRLNIDRKHCLDNLQRLKQHQAHIQEKLMALYSLSDHYVPVNDVDGQLYQGFLNSHDKTICDAIRSSVPALLSTLTPTFEDSRLKTLYFRYKARNYPDILTEKESRQWLDYRRDKLTDKIIQDYLINLELLAQQHQQSPDKLALLKSLYDYCYYLTTV
ncbi:exodeoxyribonuclease I [Utexia brackfieldae]|uniref:exodeoxyribonuclease I n=1 Tax=Utexia brackfieldae TaxID=3074108 RepID=UPI00370D6ADE